MKIQPLPYCAAFGRTYDLDDPAQADQFISMFTGAEPYSDAVQNDYEAAFNYALETIHEDNLHQTGRQ